MNETIGVLMDLNLALKRIIETGKVDFGSEKTVKNIMSGDAKLVVIASNCPKPIREEVERYAKIENIPVIKYSGTALQLGEACGKPFLIAALTVLNPGSVSIGELA
jgi:large subunit ribosomal protein L30e